MRFVDECLVHVEAGHGGDGCVAFRREKFVPFGGPSGGDGGRGGSVVLAADPGLGTLFDIQHQRVVRAASGAHGEGKDKYGRSGGDMVVRVPPGTVVFDAETKAKLGELLREGDTLVVAEGGAGGRGNKHFATPVDRAPRRSEPGRPGVQRTLRLELKVMADVGLLGYPNVGKSTLIRAVSRARPKVADYPFTTLHPNLGVVRVDDLRSFVIADIPGVIEGAADGAGLGLQFLRHLSRTGLLLHVIDVAPYESMETPVEAAQKIIQEIELWSDELASKPRWLVLNKTDRLPEGDVDEHCRRIVEELGWQGPVYTISALKKQGTQELMYAIMDYLERERQAQDEQG